MTEKQSTLEEIKARMEKQSKRSFSKQSLKEMPRIYGLLDEVKAKRSGRTNATRSSIR
jgi:hypothetical protein